MKIIDAHIHTSFFRKDLQAIAKKNGIILSMDGLRAEMKKNNAVRAITITDVIKDATPIGSELLLKQLNENKSLIGVCGVNPELLNKKQINKTRELLQKGLIKGLKIYLGYYARYPFDARYKKIFSLAQKYNCPVIFHTGDTLSTMGKTLVKYAHPLNIDEVAVAWPKMKIVIAHAGYPWVIDAAEVAYKNENVFVDISGWIFGNKINSYDKDTVKRLIEYTGPHKILYGTDWPLVKMETYLKFFKTAIPKKYWKDVFYNNARRVFNL